MEGERGERDRKDTPSVQEDEEVVERLARAHEVNEGNRGVPLEKLQRAQVHGGEIPLSIKQKEERRIGKKGYSFMEARLGAGIASKFGTFRIEKWSCWIFCCMLLSE